jgi:hypothetical protein
MDISQTVWRGRDLKQACRQNVLVHTIGKGLPWLFLLNPRFPTGSCRFPEATEFQSDFKSVSSPNPLQREGMEPAGGQMLLVLLT